MSVRSTASGATTRATGRNSAGLLLWSPDQPGGTCPARGWSFLAAWLLWRDLPCSLDCLWLGLAGLALLQLWPNVPDVCRPAVRPPVARPPQPHPALAWLSAASASARCEPVPAFPLLPGPSPCLARPSAAPTSARCEPFLANSLLPGPSTHPAWPSAASASARYEPFPTNRLTPASRNSGTRPGTMAAGAREQAASCDAFVLSRRPPAPGVPPNRTSPACLIAKAPSNSHRTTARSLAEQGLPPELPSCSVKDPSARQRSGRGWHDRRGLAGWVGHENTA